MAVVTTLIRAVYGQNYTDVGPFRLVRYPACSHFGMTDEDHGFMIEMRQKRSAAACASSKSWSAIVRALPVNRKRQR